jgi:DNA-binding transcriptional MerR regulator
MPLTAQEAITTFNADQFNIQVASKLTGLNPHTIRAWEKRYQAVTPARDEKGRRVYNKDELSRLALLNQLVFNGHNISSIAYLSEQDLNSLYENLFQKPFDFDEFQNESKAEPFNTQESLQNLTFALITQSMNIVNHELDKARKDLSGYSFVKNIVEPFLKEIKVHLSEQRLDNFQYETILNLVRSQLATKTAQQQTVSDQNIDAVVYHQPGIKNEIEAYLTALTLEQTKTSFQFIASDISPESAAMMTQQFGSKMFIYAGHADEFEKSHLQSYEFLKKMKPHVNSGIDLITVGTERLLFSDIKKFDNYDFLKEYLEKKTQNIEDQDLIA